MTVNLQSNHKAGNLKFSTNQIVEKEESHGNQSRPFLSRSRGGGDAQRFILEGGLLQLIGGLGDNVCVVYPIRKSQEKYVDRSRKITMVRNVRAALDNRKICRNSRWRDKRINLTGTI